MTTFEVPNAVEFDLKDTVLLQWNSVCTFMYALGYLPKEVRRGIMFESDRYYNRHNKNISFESAVMLHNHAKFASTPSSTKGCVRGYINVNCTRYSKKFVFSEYVFNLALSSRIVDSVGLYIQDGETLDSNKTWVKFVNGSEILFADAYGIKL